jgi:hypothetical protein
MSTATKAGLVIILLFAFLTLALDGRNDFNNNIACLEFSIFGLGLVILGTRQGR